MTIRIDSVPKLIPGNYRQWSQALRGIFLFEGWDHVITPDPKAGGPIAPTDPAELKEWRIAQRKVAGCIFSTISEHYTSKVSSHLNDPWIMWRDLAEMHTEKTASGRYNAWLTFFNATLGQDEDHVSFALRLRTLEANLEELRPVVFPREIEREELTLFALLRNMKDTDMRKVLLLQKNVTWDDALQAIERVNAPSNAPLVLESANAARDGNSRCRLCKEMGHWSDSCPRADEFASFLARQRLNSRPQDNRSRQRQRSKRSDHSKPPPSPRAQIADAPDVESNDTYDGESTLGTGDDQ